MLKLIHPKIGTVREVSKTHQNKIRILRRAGFVDFDTYKPKKKPKAVVPPSLAEEVEGQKLEKVDQSDVADPVTAIHVSAAARKLIADNDLDAELIEGSGKDGQIVKPDVVATLEALAEIKIVPEEVVVDPETEEAFLSAEDISTHDDPEVEEEPVVRAATEEEEAEEEVLAESEGGLEEEVELAVEMKDAGMIEDVEEEEAE